VLAAFHQLRLQEAEKLWQNLFIHGFSRLSLLICQQVNQKLFSDIINCHLSMKLDKNSTTFPALTSDEENILMDAAGYIPLKLLYQYGRSLVESIDGIIEVLTAMTVNGEESSVLEYTTKWICLVNSGGLFEINDTVFEFFKAIQKKLRQKLLMAFDRNNDQDDYREIIVDSIACDA